jgi:uncharacterized protein (DUF1697 family)
MRCVALLRGVNVGGARSLPMRELKEAFTAAGATAAATVIQSGNVVFESDRPEATCVAAAAAVEAKLGFRPPIVLRSATAWQAMVEANPFVAAGVGPEALHLACLAAQPSPSAARLDPRAFRPDEFVLAGVSGCRTAWPRPTSPTRASTGRSGPSPQCGTGAPSCACSNGWKPDRAATVYEGWDLRT